MRLATGQPLPLSYPTPGLTKPSPRPGAVGPLLTILPGVACWILFASAAMPREFPVLERLSTLFGTRSMNGVLLATWGLSIVISLASLIYYGRRPQAWYTLLCMALNLTGLLFSVLLLAGLAILMVT